MAAVRADFIVLPENLPVFILGNSAYDALLAEPVEGRLDGDNFHWPVRIDCSERAGSENELFN